MTSDGYSENWDCFPKIEILSKEKAKLKTRLISGTSCEMAFLGAQLFSQQNLAINKRPFKTRSAVGISSHGGGWHEIAEFIGEQAESSDVSGYDQSLSPALLHGVYRVREMLMRFKDTSESGYSMSADEHRELFWKYFGQLVRSRMHTSSGRVFNVCGGNKSGQYNTCHDNTIAHILAIFYALLRCGFNYRQCVSFVFLVFGDDLIARVFPKNFWLHYQELGFKIKQIVTGPIDKQEFLSHKFLKTYLGYMPVHKNEKALFSACTSESKHWKKFRNQKLYSLWLGNFWKFEIRDILEECLNFLNVPFSHQEALYYWSFMLGGGGFKNSYNV